MTTENTTPTVEIRDNAYWPNEALLANFVEQADRAEQADQTEKTDRVQQTDRTLENTTEYAALYFVS